MTDASGQDAHAAAADMQAAAASVRRRAVVVIHGIGEQRPMETLRGFVDAVLDTDGERPRLYSKPDSLADGFELRRLVAADSKLRTDFHELYWAHLMPIAATDRLTAWYSMLLRRAPAEVPARFRAIWWLSWAGIAIAAVLITLSIVSFFTGGAAGTLPKLPWGLAFILAALWLTVRAYAGDAAVYLSPNPRNVEARNRIRQAALDLLEKLHASRRYERIVIVGHSLGSVVGYDMLTYRWQRASDRQRDAALARDPAEPLPERPARAKATELARAMAEPPSPGQPTAEDWQRASADLLPEEQAGGLDWLVSDFITLGSPLAHGSLLLAVSRADFDRRIAESELPTAPPLLDDGRFLDYPVFPRAGGPRPRVLHHAACFAVMRWTNLYFPCRFLVWGDLVGGAVAPLFGRGVRDVALATRRWAGFLAHTHYWTIDRRDAGRPGSPVETLRALLVWR